MAMRGTMKLRNRLMLSAMTPMERRAGRFLRAPDHDAGTGGGSASESAGGADDGAAAAAAGEGEGQGASGGDAGAADGASEGDKGGESGGADDGDDDSTALGGQKKDGEGDAAGEGEGGDDAGSQVPEAYDLTAPEGMTIDPALLEEATPIFKEAGLTNDQANAILPAAKSLMEKTQNATVQSMIDAGNQQRKAWLDEAKADAEIGGNKWDASLDSAGRGLDALGHPEGSPFRQALNETGFGNHPEMIRIFAKIGSMVGEDGDFVRPNAGAAVKQSREEVLYPNDVRKEGA